VSVVKKRSQGKGKSRAKTGGPAVDALQQSEERYRLLVENAPLGILTCDTAGNIVTVNRKVLEFIGSGSLDCTRSANLLSFQPLIDAGIAGDFAACLSTGRALINERNYLSFSNKNSCFRYNLSPLFDREGIVTGLQGIFEDVTEIKRAEEALRNSEARYHTLFENAGAAILVVDTATGMILDCNTIAEKLVGRTRDEIKRMTITQLHPPESAEGYGNSIRGDARQGNTVSLEAEVLHRDGRRIPVIINAKPMEVNGRTVTMGLLIDITERKRSDAVLRQSEEQFRALAETASVAICIMQDGRFKYINKAMEAISGYTKEELISIDFRALAHPGVMEYVNSRYGDWLLGVSDEAHSELKCIRKDGDVRWADVSRKTISYEGKPAILLSGIDITERKRAEEALRAGEERLQLCCATARMGTFDWDIPNDRHVWSSETYKIYGLPPDTHLNRKLLDEMIYPGDRLDSVMDAGLDPEGPGEYTMEYRIRRASDGAIRWVYLMTRVIFEGEGKARRAVRVLGAIQDITERKRAEGALRDSERFLNNVLDSITDGISILDRDMNIISVNRTMEKWHPDVLPLAGKKCYSAYHGWSVPCEWCPSIKVIQEKSPQIKIVPRDVGGKTVGWQEVHSYPLHDDAGHVVGVISYVRDITERKLAEDALRESEEKFRVLAEASYTMIWLYQGERFVYVNSAGERLTGYTIDEFMQMKFWDVVHPDDRDLVRSRGLARQRGEAVPGKYEVRLLTREGETRWAELTAGRILYRGEPAGIATFFDITERKRAEAQLASAKAEAELYLDLMGHDINNMNQVTQGFIEVACNKAEREGKLTPADFYLLEKALKSVQNSTNLIKNVQKLQWARLGKYEPEVLDLGEILKEVILQHGNVPDRDLVIRSDVDNGCFVKANWLLKDVFINLIGNAIKHSDGPLNINIRVSKAWADDQAYWNVVVEDDGPGIPDCHKKTLFDRLSLSSSRARGKGFGLCLIKLLIDDYRGEFRVEDRVPGDHTKGARFVVMLPAVPSGKP